MPKVFQKIINLLALLIVSHGMAIARITVEVSDDYSAIDFQKTDYLAPGKSIWFDLHLNRFRDKYEAKITTSQPGIEFYLIDGRDRDKNNTNPTPVIHELITNSSSFEIDAPPSNSGLMGAAINKSRINIKTTIVVTRRGKRPPDILNAVRNYVSIPIDALDKVYILPDIQVIVRPCGTINSYSTPNIYICTELIADLDQKSTPRALYAILLHELAHSLLYSWQLPGYDNEDMADEFAAVILAKYLPNELDQYIEWLEKHDSISEAAIQISGPGDRHTLSIQRARNMQKILKDPTDSSRRWSKLLAPYTRNQFTPSKMKPGRLE